LADGLNFFRREESDFNSAAIRMGQQFHYYLSSRARSLLGYETRPIDDSIRDAIDWLRHAGHLPVGTGAVQLVADRT
jgi:hypothetical protein